MNIDIQKFVQAIHVFIETEMINQQFRIMAEIQDISILKDKLRKGVRLFDAGDCDIGAGVIDDWIDELTAIFYRFLPEREQEVRDLHNRIASSSATERSFFKKRLPAQRIRTAQRQLAIDLEHIFGLYLARPVLQTVAKIISDKLTFDHWQLGFCPVCGGDPALAFIHTESGRRHLWCAHCTSRWYFPRVQCPYCGERDQNQLHYFEQAESQAYRMKVCNSCFNYIREYMQDDEPQAEACDTWFLETTELQMLAAIGGYVRPAIDEHYSQNHFPLNMKDA